MCIATVKTVLCVLDMCCETDRHHCCLHNYCDVLLFHFLCFFCFDFRKQIPKFIYFIHYLCMCSSCVCVYVCLCVRTVYTVCALHGHTGPAGSGLGGAGDGTAARGAGADRASGGSDPS